MQDQTQTLEVFPTSSVPAVVGVMLVALCETKRGTKLVKRAREKLEGEYVRAHIVKLRGPPVREETIVMLEAGIKTFDGILAVARAQGRR